MAVLQDDGRAALAEAVKSRPIHLAWGSGDPAWDSAGTAPEPKNAAALVAEVGRRVATETRFVMPDPAGEISVVGGRYKLSETPTKWLLVRFVFDFLDAPAAQLREVGIFLGTVVKPELPPGQRYFIAADLLSPGKLYALERFDKTTRSPSIRQTFEYVLPF
ncbi:hypothetical protein ACFOLJ_30990 [Rugamonas sp. CCM 8940]|uniref:hypothetical protein n=1 Tax=Rugamonas sp. CCM 8940 TaxID=2765359 RepID=UPI0018F4704B|nr:hypothetical protein [Rugamonas sp. CCM 8940]MBJ7309220.1 hypothetical protein [Rugamonas sp. CCM 8940]